MRWTNALRRIWLASVSRSLAWTDFFQTQPQLLHDPGHVCQADRLPGLLKLGLQLAQEDIGLALDQAAYPFRIDPTAGSTLENAHRRPSLSLCRRYLERPANVTPKRSANSRNVPLPAA